MDGEVRDPLVWDAANQPPTPGPHRIIPAILPLFIFVLIFVLQFSVEFWKKKHPSSFLLTTVALMTFIPGIFSFIVFPTLLRFNLFWLVYTCGAAYMLWQSIYTKPMKKSTPRIVYQYFYYIYKFSHFASIFGVMLILFEMLGFFDWVNKGTVTAEVTHSTLPTTPDTIDVEYHLTFKSLLIPLPSTLLVYGLYFGILCRDTMEILAERIANNIEKSRNQYYSSPNSGVCGVCDIDIQQSNEHHDENGGKRSILQRKGLSSLDEESSPSSSSTTANRSDELVHTLPCGHKFHEFCLRGWILIGKKNFCPVCREKTDTSIFKSKQVWQSNSAFYLQLLDIVRYFFAWNPIIVLVLFVIIKIVLRFM